MPGPQGEYTEPPIALLTLEHAGRTWRVAYQACDVLDKDGVWHHYQGGLAEADIHREAIPFSFEMVGQIDLEAIMSGDFAALQAEGDNPSTIVGEIALWRRGDGWDDRERFQKGVITVQSWGNAAEPARFTIAPQDPADDNSVWPPVTQTITDQTWYTAGGLRDHDEDEVGGRAYPQVFGRMGLVTKRGGPATIDAVPAYCVRADAPVFVHETPFHGPTGQQIVITDFNVPPPSPLTTYYLIAGHWIWPHVRPATLDIVVTIHDNAGASSECYLYFAEDGRGQIVALAGDEVVPVPLAGTERWASFENGSMGNERYDGPMRDAGELLSWILARTSREVDWRRSSAALRQLGAFHLAGYWDQSCSPWRWGGDHLSELLPVSICGGPDGTYPLVWRWTASARDARVHLVDGLNCTVEGDPVQEGEDEILSSSRITYATSLRTSSTYGEKGWQPAPDPPTVHDSASLHTRRAALASGGRDELIETKIICDDAATADLVLAWRTWAFSAARTRLHVVGDGLFHRQLGHLEPGDVVTITSERLGYSERVAHVARAGWIGSLAYADLLLFPEP